ncbi:hypothetical protein TNCV_1920681 [Trichonephila clavipes]|nr:hypothetical protein TNCV_1920681 [Trichonephila clavipes]
MVMLDLHLRVTCGMVDNNESGTVTADLTINLSSQSPVESELKKVDEEKKESSGSESSDSEERLSIQKRQQLALVKKDKGNDFFKNGDYDSAINSYTVGM